MSTKYDGRVVRSLRLPTTDYTGSPIQVVSAEQGDVQSRYLKVVLYDDSGNIDMSKYNSAVLKAEMPDGTVMTSDGEVVGGAAYLVITPEMLLDNGKLRCNVVLGGIAQGGQSIVLTSKYFYMHVCRTNLDTGGENYNILITLVQRVYEVEKTIAEAESGREDAETVRVNNEFGSARLGIVGRVAAEAARVAAETARATTEAARVTAESNRTTTEAARVTAETARAAAESARVTAETNRASAETSRASAEAARVTAETNRASAETGRASAESARVTVETNRVTAETGRASAESARVTAENNRVTAENNRTSAEAARVTAETNRASAETGRATAESNRATTETARVTAESNRVTTETSRVTAENNRATTEASRVTAETNRATAENNRVTAEAARVAAESNRAIAENTRAESEAKRIDNEEDRQIAYQIAALDASEAKTAAVNAEASALASEQSAAEAQTFSELAQQASQETAEDLLSEIERATDAEAELRADIDSEILRAQSVEENNADAITEEIARAESAEAALDAKIDEEVEKITDRLDVVEEVIPNDATDTNKLVSESSMEAAIEQAQTRLLTFNTTREHFKSYDDLADATAFFYRGDTVVAREYDRAIVLSDETKTNAVTGINPVTMYVFDGTVWVFRNILSHIEITQAQWNAMNSLITTALRQSYDDHLAETALHVTQGAKDKLDALPTKAALDNILLGKINVNQGAVNHGRVLTVDLDGNVVPQDPSEMDMTPFIKVPQAGTALDAAPYITTAQNLNASVFVIDPIGPGGFTEGIRGNRNRGQSPGWGGQIIGGRANSVRSVDPVGDGPLVENLTEIADGVVNPNSEEDAQAGTGIDSSRPANEMPGWIATSAGNVGARGTIWLAVTPSGDLGIGQSSPVGNTIPTGLTLPAWSDTLTDAERIARNQVWANRVFGTFNPGEVDLRVDLNPVNGQTGNDAQATTRNVTGPRRTGNANWHSAIYQRRSDGQLWLSGHPVHYPSINGELAPRGLTLGTSFAASLWAYTAANKTVALTLHHLMTAASAAYADRPPSTASGNTVFFSIMSEPTSRWTSVLATVMTGAAGYTSATYQRTLTNTGAWLESTWIPLTNGAYDGYWRSYTWAQACTAGLVTGSTGSEISSNGRKVKIQGAYNLNNVAAASVVVDAVLFTMSAGLRPPGTRYVPCTMYQTVGANSVARAGILGIDNTGVVRMHRWPEGTGVAVSGGYVFIDVEYSTVALPTA